MKSEDPKSNEIFADDGQLQNIVRIIRQLKIKSIFFYQNLVSNIMFCLNLKLYYLNLSKEKLFSIICWYIAITHFQ